MNEKIITTRYQNVGKIEWAKPTDLTIPKYRDPTNLRKKNNESHHKKKEFPIKHPKNLKRPSFDHPIDDDFEEAQLTDNVLHQIEHVLHRDEKRKPKDRKQKLKLASRHSNFSPLTRISLPDGSLLVFPKSKKKIKEAAIKIEVTDERKAQLRIKQRLARRIQSGNRSQKAEELREQAEIPYHKAHKVSISLNLEDTIDETDKEKIKQLRKLLFINQKEEGIKTGFMAKIFTGERKMIKKLANLIFPVGTENMRIFYFGKTGPGKELSPNFLEFTSEKDFVRNGLTNQDLAKITDPNGKHKLTEVPIIRLNDKFGNVILEVTCSYPRWSATHPGNLNNLNGSWIDGQINFYHRQKKLEREQIEEIFDRWLEINEKD